MNRKTDSSVPEFTVPDNWNALSRKQLFQLIRLFRFNLDQTAYKLIALNKLADIKVTGNKFHQEETDRWQFEIKHRGQKHWFTAGLYNELIKCMNFVSEAPTLTKQLLPKISYFGLPYSVFGHLYGPEEACYNITYNELIHAQLAYANFTNTKQKEYLNQLVAILYRPKPRKLNTKSPQWNGDYRQPFSAYLYPRRVKYMRLVPYRIKYAIYIFYSGSLALMETEHPLCFAKSTRISSQPKQANPAKELINLIPVVSKNDPTKEAAILNAMAWTVFDNYESARKEYEMSKPKK